MPVYFSKCFVWANNGQRSPVLMWANGGEGFIVTQVNHQGCLEMCKT